MKFSKVVKVALVSVQKDKEGNEIDYKTICQILWDLQRETREIRNKSIQYCWEFSNFSNDYKKEYLEYPKPKDVLNYASIDGYVYDRLKENSSLHTNNFSTSTRDAIKKFKNLTKDILSGKCSIPEYKNNQPLDLHNKSIGIDKIKDCYYITLKLLNKRGKEKYDFGSSSIKFKALVKDNSTKTIINRLLNGEYKIGASKLIYNQKKKQWFLNLTYNFESEVTTELDEEKILGVDLGINCPFCASVYGSKKRLMIPKDEIEHFRNTVEVRRKALLKQGPFCGEGRVGHGRNTRNKPAYDIGNKVARFRDTVNHKYSRELVNYAVKNHCGVIQMEDLTGINKDSDKTFLRNWSYYDLQTKIEYKAKEAGIKVKYINPMYTTQRCCKCGHIESDNVKKHQRFACSKCGYTENADYNASQNIAMPDVEEKVAESLKVS